MRGAYYNESDPFTAEWLRSLIANGLVAPGDVDARDVRDVCADDLRGYTQCHFFAGIGLWSLALRWAGWPDDRPVWTGSCPCQPFSQAGKGGGFADERHLWPAWHWLLRQRRPGIVFGEQVESPDGRMWFDLVSTNLEADGYAIGAVDFPSAGIGAPNIRQRLYWVADSVGERCDGQSIRDQCGQDHPETAGRGSTLRLVHPESGECGIDRVLGEAARGGQDTGQSAFAGETAGGGVANTSRGRSPSGPHIESVRYGAGEPHGPGAPGRVGDADAPRLPDTEPRPLCGAGRGAEGRAAQQYGCPPNPWREPEWVFCRDERFRPFEPGAFPLSPRDPGDVGKLRAYGNAINPYVAAAFIKAYRCIRA